MLCKPAAWFQGELGCVVWLKRWEVVLEIHHYNWDPLGLRWQGMKDYGAFVAFLTHVELVSVLLRLN